MSDDTLNAEAVRLVALLRKDADEQNRQPPEMTGLFPADERDAADLIETLRARAEAAEGERDRLREALEPFSIFAGSLFAKNFNKADDVVSLRDGDGESVLVAGAFFNARAALTDGKGRGDD